MATINEKIVAALPAPASGNKLHYFSGATLQAKKAPAGFAVRVTAAGTKSFVWFHRVGGRPHLETIGRWNGNDGGGELSVLQAIMAAQERALAIRNREADPRPERTRRLEEGDGPKAETIGDLLDDFFVRYVTRDAALRSAANIKAAIEKQIKPAIGAVGVYELKRFDVIRMLDNIADTSGPVQADRVLSYVSKAFNWRAIRDENFNSPIVRGMARTKPKERARDRILSDEELRDVWRALDLADVPACFPALVKVILLTATRRGEAAGMRWGEIAGDVGDVWTIPAARYKTKTDYVVPLSAAARALIGDRFIRARPAEHASGSFVFSTNGGVPLAGFSKPKGKLDRAIAELRAKQGRGPMPAWTWHDLRRTARSLLSRAGVNADIAERCLGHTIGGVRGIYDRHTFLDEKRQAFEALAELIARILNPAPNVTRIKQRNTAS
jgi:integrase